MRNHLLNLFLDEMRTLKYCKREIYPCGHFMSNIIKKMIVLVLMGQMLLILMVGTAIAVSGGPTETLSGPTQTASVSAGTTTTLSGTPSPSAKVNAGTTSTLSGATPNATVNGSPTASQVDTVTAKASPTGTASVPEASTQKTPGFQVVLSVITLFVVCRFKLNRR